MKRELLFCLSFYLFILTPCIVANATEADFRQLYDSVYADFHHRFFSSSFGVDEHYQHAIDDLYLLESVKQEPLNHARIQYLEALMNFCHPSPDNEKIISLTDAAIGVLSKEKYPEEHAKLLTIKGAVCASTNRFVDAYHCYCEALNLLDPKKDPAFVAFINNDLAILWSELNEWETALEYATQSEKLWWETGYKNTAFFIRANKYAIHLQIENIKEVIPQIEQDILLAEKSGDTLTGVYLNLLLGRGFILEEALDSAFHYLSRALSLAEEYSETLTGLEADILFRLGNLFFEKKDYTQSELFLNRALPYIKQLNRLSNESEIYAMLSEIHVVQGDDRTAFVYLNESVRLKDSLAIQEKTNQIQRAKSRSELTNYQQQLQIIQQEAKIRDSRALLIILGLLLALVVIASILLYLGRERKLRKMKILQLEQQLENEEINNQLEKIAHERQMEEKEREMATTHLLVTEKNKVLENLLTTFRPFYEEKKLSKELWMEMKKFTTDNLKKEGEWEKSKIHFEKVHPDFFKKLKEIAPNLTENDLRLSAYIRIGMRTKQIAEMLSVRQGSVLTNRYNLKKKLNLNKEESLDDFIRNI